MDFVWLAIGLLLVVKGADVMIDSLSDLGRLLNVPSFILGLIAVSVGTSAPEAAIGVISGIRGVNQVSLGTVIGSNTVNVLVVLAITAIVSPLLPSSGVTRRTIPMTVFVEAAFLVMLWSGGGLSRFEALFLLAGAFAFTAYTVVSARQAARNEMPDTPFEGELFEYLRDEAVLVEPETASETVRRPAAWLVFLFIISLAAVIGGAQLALDGAVGIARRLHMSEAFIGLTVIAFGTSLPELVASLTAVRKGEPGIAVGNAFGSNIYNTLLVLGLTGTINPLSSETGVLIDSAFMLFAAVFITLPAIRRMRISRKTGIACLVLYIGYMIAKVAVGF